MSMIGNLLRISTKQIEALRADPSRIERVLHPQSDGDTAMSEDVHADIDKAWHGLHYLLTGQAWDAPLPLAFLVCGTELGDIDVGYGPARAFDAGEVRAIAEALQPITTETLRARFDGAAMMKAEIYPQIWDRDPATDDTLGYLLEYFELLKTFVLDTAEAGAGLIVYLN